MEAKILKHKKILLEFVKLIHIPENEEDHNILISFIDELLDIGADDPNHELASVLALLTNLIEDYENKLYGEEPRGTGIDALRYLMEAHNLKQSQLPEVGTQSVISELLMGKRAFNTKQIKALSERFNVSPAVFF